MTVDRNGMGDASEPLDTTVDVGLVAAQFDVLDSDTHRKALLEAIRARNVYRQLIQELRDENDKLKHGLIGPKSERIKDEDDSQLSLQVLAELPGRDHVQGADPSTRADEVLAQAEQEAKADADEGGQSEDGEGTDRKVHRRPRKPTGRRTAREDVVHKLTLRGWPMK